MLLAAAREVPYGVDEFGLAGALDGALVPVVQAETFDALVPAIRQPWQALRAAEAFNASLGKYFIAAGSDIDLDSLGSAIWAVPFSTQSQRDVEIIRGKVPRLDPSVPSSSDMVYPDGEGASAMLINACPEQPLPAGLPAAPRLHGESSRALG